MIDAEHANRAETAAVLGVSLEELPELTTTEVELTTLDQLVADGVIDPGRIGMLWVDVENHEGHVLGGARTLVEVGVPTVFEFHPAGLAERGDTGRIQQVADACYTHFVDVRRPAPKRGHPGLRLQPVAELSGYADRFLSESTEGVFTDLLLLRLTPSQVEAGTKLRKAVTRRRRDAQRRQAS